MIGLVYAIFQDVVGPSETHVPSPNTCARIPIPVRLCVDFQGVGQHSGRNTPTQCMSGFTQVSVRMHAPTLGAVLHSNRRAGFNLTPERTQAFARTRVRNVENLSPSMLLSQCTCAHTAGLGRIDACSRGVTRHSHHQATSKNTHGHTQTIAPLYVSCQAAAQPSASQGP